MSESDRTDEIFKELEKALDEWVPSDTRTIREKLVEESGGDDELVFIDGYDKAIIGTARNCGMDQVVAYSVQKIIQIIMEKEGWTEDEAGEWYDYNIVGGSVGEKTPIFVDCSIHWQPV